MKKTALVTGASSGIGKEFCIQLANKGYNLVVVARREKLLKALARQLTSVRVDVYAMDLTEPEATQKLMAYLKEQQINIDVLINNAGVGITGPMEEIDLKAVFSSNP